MNSSPARGFTARLPSVLKKELPTKSGTVSTWPSPRRRARSRAGRRGARRRRPARGARAPCRRRVRRGDEEGVGAARSGARAAASRRAAHAAAPRARRARRRTRGSRAWMYFGQLPKLCCTSTAKPARIDAATTAVHAVAPPRVRLDAEQADRRAGARCARQRIAAAAGSASMRRCCASGECTKPGGAGQHDGPGLAPRVQRCRRSTKGSCAKNSRCWSGMWSRITRGADLLHALAHAGARLHGALALVPGGRGSRSCDAQPASRRRAPCGTKPRQGLDARQPGAQLRVGLAARRRLRRVRDVGVVGDVGQRRRRSPARNGRCASRRSITANRPCARATASARVPRPLEQHDHPRRRRAGGERPGRHRQPALHRAPRPSGSRGSQRAGSAA